MTSHDGYPSAPTPEAIDAAANEFIDALKTYANSGLEEDSLALAHLEEEARAKFRSPDHEEGDLDEEDALVEDAFDGFQESIIVEIAAKPETAEQLFEAAARAGSDIGRCAERFEEIEAERAADQSEGRNN